MNFDQLLRSLPNGFHDALLRGIEVDYCANTAILSVEIDLWDHTNDANAQNAEDAFRPALIGFSEFYYLIIEPSESMPRKDSLPLWIDAGILSDLQNPPQVCLPRVPESASVCWFYVHNWNSYIYLAANEISMDLL